MFAVKVSSFRLHKFPNINKYSCLVRGNRMETWPLFNISRETLPFHCSSANIWPMIPLIPINNDSMISTMWNKYYVTRRCNCIPVNLLLSSFMHPHEPAILAVLVCWRCDEFLQKSVKKEKCAFIVHTSVLFRAYEMLPSRWYSVNVAPRSSPLFKTVAFVEDLHSRCYYNVFVSSIITETQLDILVFPLFFRVDSMKHRTVHLIGFNARVYASGC